MTNPGSSLQREVARNEKEGVRIMNLRSADWLGGLAAGLLVRAVVASAGVGDTPLPTFSSGGVAGPAVAVYYAVGAIKNNGLEADFVCTNTTLAVQNIGVQFFDETGALRNDFSAGTNGEFLNVAVGRTVTVASGGTAVLHEDQTISLNLAGSGLISLRNGSARIVSTSNAISCVGLLVDKFHIIVDPNGVTPPPVGHTSTEAAPTIANLRLFKLP